MLSKLKKSNNEGFTIIEIMIVLVIAGLILLIVFLAVPALQRNARNTQRKNDVSQLLSSINEFTNNGGGTAPATQANINTITGNIRLGYYRAANVFYGTTPTAVVSTSSTTPAANTNTTEEINVYVGYVCPTANGVAVRGQARSVALEYVVEGAGNGVLECQQS